MRYYLIRLQMWWGQSKERSWTWVIWHLPERLIYWALIRAWARATTGPWSGEEATGVLMRDVIRRWESTRGR